MPGRSRRQPSSVTLSQHFLRPAVAERIIASTGLAPPSLVFDLGAGEGALTAPLASRGCRVVAVELDRDLWSRLRGRFRDDGRVEPVLADLMKVRLPPRRRYSVVSNVPFALTARLMRHLQEAPNPPSDAWLVLQEEAARKWAGIGHETQASLLLKLRFEVNVGMGLRRTDFAPHPAVDSVVVHLRRRPRPLLSPRDAKALEARVRYAFAGPHSVRARERSFEDWLHDFHASGRRPARRP